MRRGGGGSGPETSAGAGSGAARSLASAEGWAAPVEAGKAVADRAEGVVAERFHASSLILTLDPEGTRFVVAPGSLFSTNTNGCGSLSDCSYYHAWGEREFFVPSVIDALNEAAAADGGKASHVAIAAREGVTIVQSQVGRRNSFGSALAHSVFGIVSVPTERPGGSASSVGAIAYGVPYHTERHGSVELPLRATWRGAMVGVPINAPAKRLAGSAELVYDAGAYAEPALDANFTGIVDAKTLDPASPDLSFTGIPFVRPGTLGSWTPGDFVGREGDAYIRGSLYGSGGDEVAGTIQTSGFVGAFGAKRVDE